MMLDQFILREEIETVTYLRNSITSTLHPNVKKGLWSRKEKLNLISQKISRIVRYTFEF